MTRIVSGNYNSSDNEITEAKGLSARVGKIYGSEREHRETVSSLLGREERTDSRAAEDNSKSNAEKERRIEQCLILE